MYTVKVEFVSQKDQKYISAVLTHSFHHLVEQSHLSNHKGDGMHMSINQSEDVQCNNYIHETEGITWPRGDTKFGIYSMVECHGCTGV